MAEETILKAQPRTVTGKQVKQLRRQGLLPAVIYGHNVTPISISLDARESGRILAGVSSSHLVTVVVDGARHTTLVRERQRHPITSALVHVDFLEVSMTEKLKANVGLRFEGESPAVKNYAGVLVTNIEALEVEALPRDLPDRIVVDVSGLANVGDQIFVRDLPIPAKVEVLTPADEVVAVIIGAAVEAEPAPAAAEGEGEPEVIERGKKEEEEF